jgi:hypothetical protein
MKTFQPYTTDRTDVLRAKYIYGIWFGASLGFLFAVFAWGFDAFMLSRLNSFYPWIKFAGGAVPCMVAGGITGWLSARIGKPAIAFILWAITAFFFAWLAVALPLRITPSLLGIVEPDIRGLLHYTLYDNFSARINAAYIWIGIFVSLSGLLQLPLSESAVFSTSALGKASPMMVCLVLMAICGMLIDGLNNELLRSPIKAMEDTLQFAVTHQGQEVDPLDSRRMRLASLRNVEDVITPEYKMIVSGYDELIVEVDILIRFQNVWVECGVFYNQPVTCKQVRNIDQ